MESGLTQLYVSLFTILVCQTVCSINYYAMSARWMHYLWKVYTLAFAIMEEGFQFAISFCH